LDRAVTPASLISSTVFRRIGVPCFALAAYAAAITAYHLALLPLLATHLPRLAPFAPPLALNLAPFSLISAFVCLRDAS
jgi:hypothetical protein